MPSDSICILVVDDNPATRYSTSRILRSEGWRIIEAATGTEGLQQAENDEVDLVVLDINLPDIDGFEVCKKIRAIERLKRIPVVHLSATFVNDVDKVHGLEMGADGYLTHPVEPPVLIATVKAFLRAREAEIDREKLLLSERAARTEAERANRVKDDFLATLSHELRTPLQAMIGWAQLLKMGGLSDAEMAEGVDAIERNAQAQSQLIADLLDISRITSGKLRLDVQPVDPSATIEAALTAVLPAAEAKTIRILRTLDPSASPVSGDPARLQQVIWNLVNNAVKFTPKEGKIQVSLEKIDSHVQISVTDTGQGIDPNLLPRIFDRFRQGDASTTRHHGGLGLGLAIAKELVELHGGRIRAESEGLGQGAKFIVTLPLVILHQKDAPNRNRSHERLTAETPLPDGVDLTGVRVLIVDDDNDARRILTRLLQGCNATTQDANSVAAALEAIDEFKPQVLVSDLGMPGEDGFELIRRVRAKGISVHELPAIALTGFARTEDRRRALLAGFQVHLAKPIDPREVSATIAALVGLTGN